jgi:hypothetical protein
MQLCSNAQLKPHRFTLEHVCQQVCSLCCQCVVWLQAQALVRPQNGLRHALSRGGMHSMPTPMSIRCEQHGEAARPQRPERNMLHRASTLRGLPGAVSTRGGHAGQRHSIGHHEPGSEPPGKRLSAPASPSRKYALAAFMRSNLSAHQQASIQGVAAPAGGHAPVPLARQSEPPQSLVERVRRQLGRRMALPPAGAGGSSCSRLGADGTCRHATGALSPARLGDPDAG